MNLEPASEPDFYEPAWRAAPQPTMKIFMSFMTFMVNPATMKNMKIMKDKTGSSHFSMKMRPSSPPGPSHIAVGARRAEPLRPSERFHAWLWRPAPRPGMKKNGLL